MNRMVTTGVLCIVLGILCLAFAANGPWGFRWQGQSSVVSPLGRLLLIWLVLAMSFCVYRLIRYKRAARSEIRMTNRKPQEGSSPMTTQVTQIVLFTVNACPTGRSIGQVLQEVAVATQLPVMTYYVDEHDEETNRYRVKTNTTTLFVNQNGDELYRFEGFKETAAVLELLLGVQAGGIKAAMQGETNQETTERYVVYLYQNETLVPVEVHYHNRTSVKTPRITAIKQLLQASPAGYENPFPAQTTLELVQFAGSTGRITLQGAADVTDAQRARMQHALRMTLAPFGIQEVEMVLEAQQ